MIRSAPIPPTAPHQALAAAIKTAGGQNALARTLNVRQSLVGYWLHASKKGAAGPYVLAIEAATNVPRHLLRPDLYEAPAVEGAAA